MISRLFTRPKRFQQSSPRPVDDLVFASCAALFILAAVVYLAFADRAIVFDEIGLHNPIYMYLNYGRMVYPVHGHFDDMTVHPPTHYLVIATLMRLGFGLFHAAAVVPCLLFITLCVLLYRSAYPFSLKTSILAGVFLGALVWNQTYTIRPDVEMALAWITGLIAMECSRQSDWEPKRLFLGSFLLAYASAVHYPAFLAGASVLIYLGWIWRTLPAPRATRATGISAAGLALVALPYLSLFLLSYRQEIAGMIAVVQGGGRWLESLRSHRQAYEFWRDSRAVLVGVEPLLQRLLLPLWTVLVPAIFVGPALLAIPLAARRSRPRARRRPAHRPARSIGRRHRRQRLVH